MRAKQLKRSSVHGQRGAVLPIVAVFVLVAVVMLAAVIDLGHQRENKKEITLSTDAAALAGASVADTEVSALTSQPAGTLVDCSSVTISPAAENSEGFTYVSEMVDHYYDDRNGGTNVPDCKVARMSYRRGYVLVSAHEIVDYNFAPAFGQDTGGVSGVSVAAIVDFFGGGLRPDRHLRGNRVDGRRVGLSRGLTQRPLQRRWQRRLQARWRWVRHPQDRPATDPDDVHRPVPDRQGEGRRMRGVDRRRIRQLRQARLRRLHQHQLSILGHFCKDYADGYYGTIAPADKGRYRNNWSDAANEDSSVNLEQYVGSSGRRSSRASPAAATTPSSRWRTSSSSRW